MIIAGFLFVVIDNLIDNPEYANKISILKKELWNLQVQYDDSIRLKNPL
ncbi:MAG TPA: hypothetical protein PKH58_02925 [Paludibacteraceae bacterium]|nr:hypothetical protein [Paludibacteraceae bacterium]HPT42485.1 hypothetical protein [Paludibacteraceae bacterium]